MGAPCYNIFMLWKKTVEKLASRAGIHIDGNDPWDIIVHDSRTYKKIVLGGSIGLGESYMQGWWDSAKLDEFSAHILKARLDASKVNLISNIFIVASQYVFNLQSIRRAFIVGEKHYDIGNDIYKKMLDSRLTYTCGYWKNAKNLEEAQEHKLRLTCEKLKLKPGMKILDIGCGWGSFAIFAAKEYGVSVVGVTISKEQIKLAQDRAGNLPVEFQFLDYRDVPKKYGKIFDRVVSLGMFEHVGVGNYKKYFADVRSVLKDNGVFLLHTIGSNHRIAPPDPWSNKYIFPNGVVPSVRQLTRAAQGEFIIEDWHNFGTDYDKTLTAWYNNIESSWDNLPFYDETFKRMWRYYLLMFTGAFRTRELQLWQIVFSKGIAGGYQSVR